MRTEQNRSNILLLSSKCGRTTRRRGASSTRPPAGETLSPSRLAAPNNSHVSRNAMKLASKAGPPSVKRVNEVPSAQRYIAICSLPTGRQTAASSGFRVHSLTVGNG